MRRKLFNLAAVTSLVLCAAVCVLWVRSYFHTDQIGRWRRWEDGSLLKETCSGIVSQDGALVIVSFDRRFPSKFVRDGYDTWNPSALPKIFDHVGWIQDPLRWNQKRFASVEGIVNQFGICYESGWGGRSAGFGETIEVRFLRIPNGFIVAGLLVLPSLSVWRRVAKGKRAKAGHCPICGYDLRATPERCPECGAVPAAADQWT